MTTGLVSQALFRAVQQKRPPVGLIHHTDRGSQYCAKAYRALQVQFGMQTSMSRKGNCFVRIPVNLNSDSGICEHHFRKVCGQGFCEQKLSFEGRHLFDSPNKPAAKRSAAVVDPGHWSMTVI